jgi:hypothetical protein
VHFPDARGGGQGGRMAKSNTMVGRRQRAEANNHESNPTNTNPTQRPQNEPRDGESNPTIASGSQRWQIQPPRDNENQTSTAMGLETATTRWRPRRSRDRYDEVETVTRSGWKRQRGKECDAQWRTRWRAQ